MDCEKFPISCQLQRLADEAVKWDLDGMWIAIFAAVAGAAIAGLLALMIFLMERRERSRNRFIDAVDRLSTAMAQIAVDNAEYLRELPKWWALDEELREVTPRPIPPERILYDLSLDLLVATTRGKQQEIAMQVRSLGYEITMLREPEHVNRELAALRRVLSAWASGRRSRSETEHDLAVLEDRRGKLEVEPNLELKTLRSLPEPFEKPAFRRLDD